MTGTEILLAASVAASAAGAVYQGVQASAQGKIVEQQYQEQAELAELQALQEENDRKERLRMILASQEAVAASSGIQLDASRSFLATQKAEREQAERDIRNIRIFGSSQRRTFLTQGAVAGAQGKSALFGSLFQGAGSLFAGGYEYKKTKAA